MIEEIRRRARLAVAASAKNLFRVLVSLAGTSLIVHCGGGESGRGTLRVAIAGLPPDTPRSVSVSGPDGFTQILSGHTTLNGLVPGSYQVSASDVPMHGVVWASRVDGSPATVLAGGNSNVWVSYDAVGASGRLQINISGLPSGTAASLVLTGPNGFSENVTASTTIELIPGTYALSANAVSRDGVQYSGTVSGSPVVVSALDTSRLSVRYYSNSAVHCVGQASSCGQFGIASCERQLGCYYQSWSCFGSAQACSSFDSETACRNQLPCRWE